MTPQTGVDTAANRTRSASERRAATQPDVAQLPFDLRRALGRKDDISDPATLREAATKLVGQLFFQPLLAELREQPFGRKFADGGRTEQIFGEHFDVRIAEAVAAADPGGLTSQIARRLQASVAGTAGVPAVDPVTATETPAA